MIAFIASSVRGWGKDMKFMLNHCNFKVSLSLSCIPLSIDFHRFCPDWCDSHALQTNVTHSLVKRPFRVAASPKLYVWRTEVIRVSHPWWLHVTTAVDGCIVPSCFFLQVSFHVYSTCSNSQELQKTNSSGKGLSWLTPLFVGWNPESQ